MITSKSLTYLIFSIFVCAGICYSQTTLPLVNNSLNGTYKNIDVSSNTVVQGEFDNNLRSGLWTIEDTVGNIVYSRKYIGPYTFVEKNNDSDKSKMKPITLQKNEDGLYEYPEINNQDVLWSKRVWCILPKNENPNLYNPSFLDQINQEVKTESLVAYRDDKISTVINSTDFDLSEKELEGVALKKDYYYDSTKKMMLQKVICFTFYLSDSRSGERSAFSLYYSSDTRELLQSFPIKRKSRRHCRLSRSK